MSRRRGNGVADVIGFGELADAVRDPDCRDVPVCCATHPTLCQQRLNPEDQDGDPVTDTKAFETGLRSAQGGTPRI